jgi:AcrR family transcriptional regulator
MPVSEHAAPARSLTSYGRRAQIVAATIEVLDQVGYGATSFARIAQHAGLSSTRLISYHFAGKDELMAEVVQSVVSDMGAAVAERMRRQRSSAGLLRAYIEGVVGFTAAHRAQVRALFEIVLAGAVPAAAVDQDAGVTDDLEQILRGGQVSGEFRDFDPRVMALAVQRAVDALPFALRADPDLDCEHYAGELVTLFELATRA